TSGLYSGVTLEALVDSSGLAANGIVPVKKALFMDLLANGWNSALDKAEGLAIINDSTIAICNDNDYGQTSPSQNGLATATSNVGHVIVYGLSGNNKLKNYVAPSFNIITGTTGPSTAQTPYLNGVAKGVKFTSVLTAGEYINSYRMCGTPDGVGAYDNGNGTFTLLVNHEFGNTAGINRAHGQKGAFVSKWVINKSDLSVVSGADLIQSVYLWNGSNYTKYDVNNPSSSAAFARFCSADLPEVSAFYNASTGLGTQERIFMNGEENGNEGRGFAHIATGANAGSTYELPYLGKFSWENSVASPYSSDKTLVIGLDDATPGQVYMYIGSKKSSGTDIEKAGLSGGKLYGITVNGLTTESSSSIPSPNTAFTLTDMGAIQNSTGSTLNSISNAAGVTNFLRPEDGAWDPSNPNDFYFVTTNSFTSPSRLWRLRFKDIANPELGGTITAVLDGTEGPKMMDNMTIDNFGHVLITEDVGGNIHNGKVWQYTIETDALTLLAEHDPNRFITGGSNFLTIDEESSGILDVQNILGPGMFILVDQAHYGIGGELVEGGQMLAMFNPETFNSNPEISVVGNGVEILRGDVTPSITDNTDFGSIAGAQTKTFNIKNNGAGSLIISSVEFKGSNAYDFNIVNAPVWPLKINANSSYNLVVKFTPSQTGLRTASITINSNDVDEKSYSYSIQGTGVSAGLTGPSSTQSPYLLPLVQGGKFTSIMTVGDYVGNYRMTGLMDGMGAFDNGNGTFTVVINHEIGNTAGVVRAHGSKGAFVSKWVINKSDLSVLSGSDLIKSVYLWNGTAYTKYDASNPVALSAFSRFCSADLPLVSAFYNSKTGLGTKERIFMNGEESGNEGRAFAHIITGTEAGVSYELPYLGKFSWENSVASPNESDKTIVVGTDDATPGQVYVYIGTKKSSGNDIEKAGLSGGKLYGVAVNGLLNESSSSVPAANTTFTLADLGQVQNSTGAALNTASNTAGVTNFLRPEDAVWDPKNPNDLYFVTTNSFSSPSRMWRLRFTDINNPEQGGTITAVLDGTEGQKMLDNMGMDNFGHVLLQEDVGNNVHNGKIWQYSTSTDALKLVAEHDQTRFISGGANFLTQDEESSGIIDVQSILGPGMFLLVDQAHYSIPGELVEGGQLLAFYNPDTYLENPEIIVSGNGEEVKNASMAAKTYDNTDFGSVKTGSMVENTFEIKNTAIGQLTVKGINIAGTNAADFTLTNLPSFPLTLTSGAAQTFKVKFNPTTVGLKLANVSILNNDFDEASYTFKIQGNATANTSIDETIMTALNIYPNPSNSSANIEIGLVNDSKVTVNVYDAQGKLVIDAKSYELSAGTQSIELETSGLGNGIYFIELTIDGKTSRYRLAVMH
ncbi:MAG TPA: choice-of-anchor D domain-containing protein, partial [Bacteroidia bacterium]